MSGSTDDLEAGIEKLQANSGGVVDVQIITQQNVPGLIQRAMAGDWDAACTLEAVDHALGKIQNAPKRKPMLCGCCPQPLRAGKYAIVVAKGADDMAGQALTLAICDRCGHVHGAAQAAASTALRRIWPNSRPITVTHADGGRA